MCAHIITLMHDRWGRTAKNNLKSALVSEKERLIACSRKVRRGGGGEGSVPGRRKKQTSTEAGLEGTWEIEATEYFINVKYRQSIISTLYGSHISLQGSPPCSFEPGFYLHNNEI